MSAKINVAAASMLLLLSGAAVAPGRADASTIRLNGALQGVSFAPYSLVQLDKAGFTETAPADSRPASTTAESGLVAI